MHTSKSHRKLPGILLVVCLLVSGCATEHTWKKTGQVEIRIADSRIVTTNGAVSAIEVVGEKSVPVIPFVWKVSSKGVVDRLQISPKVAEQLETPVGPVATNGMRRISVFRIEDFRDGNEQTTNAIPVGCHTMLIADLNRCRKYLAGQIAQTESRTAFVLDDPWIRYDEDVYVRNECNARVVTERILFVPVAFAWDVVTFPIQFVLGLFTHM